MPSGIIEPDPIVVVMDPRTEEHIMRIVGHLEPAVIAIRGSRGWDFPASACWYTCQILIAVLEVERVGRFKKQDSYFVFETDSGAVAGHTWIEYEGDFSWWKTSADHVDLPVIIDPTIGQFVPGPACRIVKPGDELYTRYYPYRDVTSVPGPGPTK